MSYARLHSDYDTNDFANFVEGEDVTKRDQRCWVWLR